MASQSSCTLTHYGLLALWVLVTSVEEKKRRTVLHGQLAGGLQARVVDRLEDLLVELLRLGRVEGQAQEDEGVGQAL
jgi:hypothetical protein